MTDIPTTFPLDVRVLYPETTPDEICAALNACIGAGAPDAARLLQRHIETLERRVRDLEHHERGVDL
jgi:hypothetical protein